MAERKVVAELVARLSYQLDKTSTTKLKQFENRLVAMTKKQRDLNAAIVKEHSYVQRIRKKEDIEAKKEEKRLHRLTKSQLSEGTKKYNKLKRDEIKERDRLLREERRQRRLEEAEERRRERAQSRASSDKPLTRWQAFNRVRAGLVAATASFGALQMLGSVVGTGQAMNRMQSSLIAITGSAAAAAREFSFLSGESQRLGLDVESMTDGFIKLRASTQDALSAGQSRELFTAYAEYGKAFGVSQERMDKGLLALSQMGGKGQVMMEELKNQFAENVPGGMQIFTAALGVSTKELMEMTKKGEVLAKDALPKVAKEMARMAREGGALERRLRDGDTSLARFLTQWKLMAKTITDTGMNDAMSFLFETLQRLVEVLRPFSSLLGGFAKGFSYAITEPFSLMADALHDILWYIDKAFGTNSRQMIQDWGEQIGKVAGIVAGFAALWKGFQLLRRIPRMVAGVLSVGRIEALSGNLGGAGGVVGVPPSGKTPTGTPIPQKGGGIARMGASVANAAKNPVALAALGTAVMASGFDMGSFIKILANMGGFGMGMKIGATAGAFTGPLAPIAVPVLSLAGGIAGGMAADMAVDKASVIVDNLNITIDGSQIKGVVDNRINARMEITKHNIMASAHRSTR